MLQLYASKKLCKFAKTGFIIICVVLCSTWSLRLWNQHSYAHNLITWASYLFPGLLRLPFLITYCKQSKTGGRNGLWMRLAKGLDDYTLHTSICSGCVSYTTCFYMHAQTMQVQIYQRVHRYWLTECAQMKFTHKLQPRVNHLAECMTCYTPLFIQWNT